MRPRRKARANWSKLSAICPIPPSLFFGSFSIYFRGPAVGKSLVPAKEIVFLENSAQALAQLLHGGKFEHIHEEPVLYGTPNLKRVHAMVGTATPVPPEEIRGDPAKVQQWMQLPENQEAFRKARQFPMAHKEADIWMSSEVPPGEYSIFFFSGGPSLPGSPPAAIGAGESKRGHSEKLRRRGFRSEGMTLTG